MKTSTIIFISIGAFVFIGVIVAVIILATKKSTTNTSTTNQAQNSNPFAALFSQPTIQQGGLLTPALQIAGNLGSKAIDAAGSVGSSAASNPLSKLL